MLLSDIYQTDIFPLCALRPGLRPVHPAGVVGQEPIHQTPFSGQELQQHQVKVSRLEEETELKYSV